MNRSAAYRRDMRNRKIASRKKLWDSWGFGCKYDGMLNKKPFVGKPPKTKNKRYKRRYGRHSNWNRSYTPTCSDTRKVMSMLDELAEYEGRTFHCNIGLNWWYY